MDQTFFSHPLSIVDDEAQVGEGTKVWAGAHIMGGAQVGRSCNIGEHCFIENGVVIGNNVKLKNNVALYTGVVCEDDVFLGPSCVFTNVINPRSFIERKHEFRKTIVRKGASIGANATVICGHTIGRYAFVGAGAVVSRDVPDYALVYGCPAEVHGYVCRCGCKLEFDNGHGVCGDCGAEYTIDGGIVFPVQKAEESL